MIDGTYMETPASRSLDQPIDEGADTMARQGLQGKGFSRDVAVLQAAMGYSFKDSSHLALALTHSSFAHEYSGSYLSCNERLEFLGDAVLGLVITHYLYKTFPNLPEGKLSTMKSRLVSGPVLCRIAKNLDLGNFLRLGKGEEKLGGRIRKSMLASALESVLGAIFLDGGFKAAQEAVLHVLGHELDSIHQRMEQYDFKSQLQKVTQNLFGIVPSYETVSQTGPDHGRVFRVRARVKGSLFAIARGPSKKSAAQRAARLVLRKIEKNSLEAVVSQEGESRGI